MNSWMKIQYRMYEAFKNLISFCNILISIAYSLGITFITHAAPADWELEKEFAGFIFSNEVKTQHSWLG